MTNPPTEAVHRKSPQPKQISMLKAVQLRIQILRGTRIGPKEPLQARVQVRSGQLQPSSARPTQ